MKRLLYILTLIVMTAVSRGATVPVIHEYDHFLRFNDSTLLAHGRQFMSAPTAIPDSAIIYLSVIINRYKTQPQQIQRLEYVVDAYRYIGNVILWNYNDYEKAFYYISEARRLAEEKSMTAKLPMIYSNLAGLWQGDNVLYSKPSQEIERFMKMGFNVALENGYEAEMAKIMTNICLVTWRTGTFGDYVVEVEAFKNYKFKTNPELREFALHFIAGLEAKDDNLPEKAKAEFAAAARAMDNIPQYRSFVIAANNNIVEVLESQGLHEQTLQYLKKNLAIARAEGQELAVMGALQKLGDYFDTTNQPDSARKYHMEYYTLHQQYLEGLKRGKPQDIEFLDNIESLDTQLQNALTSGERQRLQLHRVLLVCLVALALLCVVLWLLRKSRRRHRQLYEAHQMSLQKEEGYLQQIAMLQEKNESLHTALHTAHTPETPSSKERYVDSPMDSTTSSELFLAIQQVMATSGEIFKPDFNIDRLAEMVDSRPRYVSQAINENAGESFTLLLSGYRIREACKRFSDVEHYGNFTVEGVAQSVGFQSRSSFIKRFKQIVGLTPSDYQKAARTRGK